MKKHIKIYLEANNLDVCDDIFCKMCGSVAVDIHHIIPKGRGGKDEAENLIALCRDCHTLAHEHKISEEELFNRLRPIYG